MDLRPGAPTQQEPPRWTLWGEKLRTVLILALTSLGVSGVLSHWAGLPAVAKLGTLLLAAPQPQVFSDRNISSELSFRVQLVSGETQYRRIDRATLARLGGPLSRTDAYVHALLGAGGLPLPLWRQVLVFGICDAGPLASAMEIGERVRRAMIRIEFRSRPESWPRALRVFCRPSPSVAIDQW